MNFQFDISSTAKPVIPQPQLPPAEMVPYLLNQLIDLQKDQIGQLLEVQKQHLNHVRAVSQEHVNRWRQMLSRWQQDHPDLTESCKKAYPIVEKAYTQLVTNLIDELANQDEDALDNDFAVQEFLDRYGMKIGQLGHLLSVIGPMSEAAQQNEAAKAQQQQQQKPA